jgi:hypothetical protein
MTDKQSGILIAAVFAVIFLGWWWNGVEMGYTRFGATGFGGRITWRHNRIAFYFFQTALFLVGSTAAIMAIYGLIFGK